MSGEARKLLNAVLRLPARERATFARSLLLSLDEEVDSDAESAWAEEIGRRVKDLDAGKTRLIPWSEVRRKLYRKIKPSTHGRRQG